MQQRKPLIMIPIIGEIICCLLLILNSIFFYELPLIFTTLGDSIPFSLSGGWPCFNIGIYSYVGSKYKDEEKTFRVGIVTATSMSALLFGSCAGGFLYQQVGFIGFYSICSILLCTGLVIGYFTIHDEQPEMEENKETTTNFKQLFGVEQLISTIKTAFKSGPNKRKCKILVCMVTLLLVAGTFNGEVSMNYMYTRLKFAWNASEFALFVGFQIFVQMLGACCDGFQMCSVIALRSLICKIVPPNELGQTNSMLALVEALIPIIFGTIYATIYQKTVDVFPGTYFFVSAGIRILGLGFFLWLYKEALLLRRRSRKEAKENSIETYIMNPDGI
ncbi:hypothetical protein WA026_021360 [Henosepilachna vigintioctopunctata]|uniref:Uncharacterized protein n=1 Tax=Henosepilachna vigintioctopunctata TaxID=420089 RepID=A0AAW1TQM5_9CUCU